MNYLAGKSVAQASKQAGKQANAHTQSRSHTHTVCMCGHEKVISLATSPALVHSLSESEIRRVSEGEGLARNSGACN